MRKQTSTIPTLYSLTFTTTSFNYCKATFIGQQYVVFHSSQAFWHAPLGHSTKLVYNTAFTTAHSWF